MAAKKYAVNFNSGELVRVDIHKSKEGYNYASVGIKKGQDHYMSIGYEWRGEQTPDFVIDVMSYFGEGQEKASVKTDKDFEDFMKRLKEEL